MELNKQYFSEVPSTINCYHLGKELYKISENCIIYEGTNTYLDEKVLIQVLPKECIKRTLSEISLINNDIYILKLLTHESILRLYEVIESYSYIFIITEYFLGEKISSFVKRNKELPENIAMVIYTEIVNAMNYIHEMNICNLNINADSIYINENLDIKIFNFKYGNYYKNKETTISYFIGDPLYSSPEIHSKIPYYPESADVWSSGILLYLLLTGKMPFEGKTSILLDKAIMKGDYEITSNISNELDELLRKILDPKINNRYTFEEIINSEYFKKNGYNDVCINDGINIINYSYPFNEKAIDIFVDYGLGSEILIRNLNKNHFNSFTSLYKIIEKNCGGYDKDNLYQKKGDKEKEMINKYLNDNVNKKEINSAIEKCLLASEEEVLGDLKEIMDKAKTLPPKSNKNSSPNKILKKGSKANNIRRSNFNIKKGINNNNIIRKSQIELIKKVSCEINANANTNLNTSNVNKNQIKNPNDNVKTIVRKSISSPKKVKVNNDSLKLKQKFRVGVENSGKRHSIILKLMENELMKKNIDINNYSPSPKKPVKRVSLIQPKGNFRKILNNKNNNNVYNKQNNDNNFGGGIAHSKTFRKNNLKFKGRARAQSLKYKNLPIFEKKPRKYRSKEIQEKITEENVKQEKEKEEKKEDILKIEEEKKDENEKKEEEKSDDSISIEFSNSNSSDSYKNNENNKNNDENNDKNNNKNSEKDNDNDKDNLENNDNDNDNESISNNKNNGYSLDVNPSDRKVINKNDDDEEEEFTGPVYKRFNMLAIIHKSPKKERIKKPVKERNNSINEDKNNQMEKQKNVSFRDNSNSYSKDLSINSAYKLTFNSPKNQSNIYMTTNKSIDSKDEKLNNNTIYEFNNIFKSSQNILNKTANSKQNNLNSNQSKKEIQPFTKYNKINNYGKAHKVRGDKVVIKHYIFKSDEYYDNYNNNNYINKKFERNLKKHNSHKKKEKTKTPKELEEIPNEKKKTKNKIQSCKLLKNLNINTKIKQNNNSMVGIKNLKNSKKNINYPNTCRNTHLREEKKDDYTNSYRYISNRNIIQLLQKKNIGVHFSEKKNDIIPRIVNGNELEENDRRNSLYRDISNRDVIKKLKDKNNKRSYENINFNINVNIITSEKNAKTLKNKNTKSKLIKKIPNYEEVLKTGLASNKRNIKKIKHAKNTSYDETKSNYTKSNYTKNTHNKKKISTHQSSRSCMTDFSYPNIHRKKKNGSHYSSEKKIKVKIFPFKKN